MFSIKNVVAVCLLTTSLCAMEGFQIGVQGGGAFSEFQQKRTITNSTVKTLFSNLGLLQTTRESSSSQGGFGGVRLGYGLFLQRFYFGLDIVGNYKNLSANNKSSSRWNFAKYKHNLDASGTLDVGYKTSDTSLIYLKGGVSYGKFKFSSWAPATTVTQNPGSQISKSYTKLGYLGGVGLRQAINKCWDIGMEYTVTGYPGEKIVQTNFANNTIRAYVHQIGVRLTFTHNPFSSGSKPKVEAKAKLKK